MRHLAAIDRFQSHSLLITRCSSLFWTEWFVADKEIGRSVWLDGNEGDGVAAGGLGLDLDGGGNGS